jgi:hypothetical protein
MCQIYHSNASTNQHVREIIQKSALEKELIRLLRTLTWMDLDDLVDCVSQNIKQANRSNVYRTLRAFGISQVPQDRKDLIKNIKEPKEDLNKFLIHYNTNRKHGGLKKELKVATPCEAVKSWFEIEPEIFKISPDEFYAIALNGMVQRGET